MSQPTVHALFLDALVAARDVLGRAETRNVYHSVSMLYEDDSIVRAHELTRSLSGPGYTLRLRVVSNLPSIEAREVLLRAIVSVHLMVNDESRFPVELCETLGCHIGREVSISERWRKLSMTRPSTSLPYAGLESRPYCTICGGIVATGAGYDPSADEPPVPAHQYVSGTPYVSFNDSAVGVTRPDVHHECRRYAQEVMLPILKAQRARAAEVAAQELDK